MTNVIIADSQATQKTISAFKQAHPADNFESIGTVADRVVSELMAKLQKSVA